MEYSRPAKDYNVKCDGMNYRQVDHEHISQVILMPIDTVVNEMNCNFIRILK